MRRLALICSLAAIAVGALPAVARADTNTFVNTQQIHIPGAFTGPGTPYPTSIAVAGLPGTLTKVRVQLIDVDIGGNREELDLALVGPGGQKVLLWSDACGVAAMETGLDYTFDDSAPSALPDAGPCPTGAYTPSNYVGGAPEPDNLSTGGGPTPPFAGSLSAFNGGPPNGTWSLFAFSDTAGDFLDIGAWALTLDFQPPPAMPAATPTGQRAAALKKCKKKRGKARKRCKRKARKLPL